VVFLALREKDPVEILKAMNRGLYDIGRENGGEALALVMWLRADGQVLYAGGIDRLFVQRCTGGPVEELPTHHIIIGKQDISLMPLSMSLSPGDNLIVASDGVIYGDAHDDQVSAMITYTPDHKKN
jgi:serine phosphatase RsbU (regulator of sigma subunit)